jgi:hypothetical protein
MAFWLAFWAHRFLLMKAADIRFKIISYLTMVRSAHWLAFVGFVLGCWVWAHQCFGLSSHCSTMPAFCFTAPVLTESEEKAAREALSPQEHEQIRQDMYGHTSSPASQQHDDGRGMQIMLEAIETSIPISEKEAYLKAVCVCPHLVERESSFWVFTV